MEIGPIGSPETKDKTTTLRDYQINRDMGKETFLKLLVTQLEHQDPLSPMDNTEFLAQLAQFSMLEGINNLGDEFRSVSKGIDALNNYTASSLVGRQVKVEGSGFEYKGSPVRLAYRLDEDAASVSVTVRDSLGKPVKSFTPSSTSKGEYEVVWDGKDELGRAMPQGMYQLEVSASDSKGNTRSATTYIMEQIRGIRLDGGKVYVSVGGMTLPLEDIKEIY